MKRAFPVCVVVLLACFASMSCGEKEAIRPDETTSRVGAAAAVHDYYDANCENRLVPLLTELVGFPTYEGNEDAHLAQKNWLAEVAAELGFEFRDAGAMYEVTLPGPDDSSVLGLLVHGDVVEAEEEKWAFPPFEATVVEGMIQGRGVADDKGPLVQALLAMKSLAEAGPDRHVTIRLIVGTSEESSGEDIKGYLAENQAPDFSLVLDSDFPLNVGEKAWNALYLNSPIGAPQQGEQPWIVEDLRAGLATSIVPDEANLVLLWVRGDPDWGPLVARLRSRSLQEGTSLETEIDGPRLHVKTTGVAAHAGDNLRNGRNALFALAGAVEGELPTGTPEHLLSFARMAGVDLEGGGLGLEASDPVWGTYDVNVATIKPDEDNPSMLRLSINVRRIPPWTQDDLKEHLRGVVNEFNEREGSNLGFDGWWDNEPLIIDPKSEAVVRLLGIYERATGEPARPNVSSGGTYAKRTPRSIAYGMWFPDKPYPGHGVDERASIESLHRGAHVLVETLVDLACTDEPLPTIVRHGAMVED